VISIGTNNSVIGIGLSGQEAANSHVTQHMAASCWGVIYYISYM